MTERNRAKIIAQINNDMDGIPSLCDINWRELLDGYYRKEYVKKLIDNIVDRSMKVAVIEAILSEYSYNNHSDDWDVEIITEKMSFKNYCNNLIQNIKDYEHFTLDAIKAKQIGQIGQLKKEIKELKKTVNEVKEVVFNNIIPDTILLKMENMGLIESAIDRPLKWLKTKALLAYFVEVANDKLNLKHGDKRQIRPFEALFNVKRLTIAINDYKKTGDLPIDYENIDALFEQ